MAGLYPVIENGVITAGNASQLSDGASAVVVMDGKPHLGWRLMLLKLA
ncbi:hypothetical protein N8456_01370 [Porticoccaceae bacterium]|nr:hypothetical protein [Porticoccaceae bacterium]